MRETVKLTPNGRINRRTVMTTIKDDEVVIRENLFVNGSGKSTNKKFYGSDRLTTTSLGNTPVIWGTRYYNVNQRVTFFFSSGNLYQQQEGGGTTTLSPAVFSEDINNISPCSVQMQVSSARLLIFSEGGTTGMFSYDGNISMTFTKQTAVTLNFVDMAVHLDRLWGFEEDSEDLYFSKNLDPFNFTDSTDAGVVTVGPRRGAKIQRIMVLNETLFIWKNDSIWALEGKTPSEFRLTEIVSFKGLASRWSLCMCENGITVGLMSDYEVWSFGGTVSSLQLLTYDLSLSGELSDGNSVQAIINKDKLNTVRAVYHNFLYRMSFTESGETQNNLEYIYNFINKTDSFTRGNSVGCYIHYDRIPDKNELVTGRSDIGRLMYQNRGQNWDNQATNASMTIKLRTKAVGLESARNSRIRRLWLNPVVGGANQLPINIYKDARVAFSDATTDNFDLQGETKSLTGMLRTNSQDAITSRFIPRWANSKGQNFSFEINYQAFSQDIEFESFEIELIKKNQKRSHKVGV